MANTPNLNLPLIAGSMTADVPRDMNALATAIDGKTAANFGGETPAGAQAKVAAHANLTNNPHGTTAAQVGAETPAAAQAKVDAHANRTDNPHGTTAAQVGAETPAAAQAKVDTHANLTNNPHGTTAAQVGAIPTSQKGAANGVASLDAGGKVPTGQLAITGSPRAATFVVAASNSSAAGKAAADYVCDGVDDQVEINNAINALPLVVWETGTAVAGAASTITFPSTRTGNVDGWYAGCTITITSGTGSGQTKAIKNYDSSTNIATVDSAWATIPDATSVYEIKSKFGKVTLLEGIYLVSNYIFVSTNCTLEGQGKGTVLKIMDGNTVSFNVIFNERQVVGVSHVIIKNLRVEGNRGGVGAGTKNGIVLSRSSHCKVQSCEVNDIPNSGISFNTLAADQTMHNEITDCTVTGCFTGIDMSASKGVVSRNHAIKNRGVGLSTGSAIDSCVITENVSQGNGTHGMAVSGTNHIVFGNEFMENSQTTSGSNNNIHVFGSSNNIQANTCRQGSLTNKPAYGISIASGATGNLVTNNDLTTGGATGAFSDAGTGTITTAGNKLA